MKRVITFLLCLLVCAGLAGCGKTPEAGIIGTWLAVQPFMPQSDEMEVEEETAEFREGGTMVITLRTKSGETGEQEIKYSVENDMVTLDGTFEFEMRDDKLLLEDEVFFEKIK